jgi:hypothetical protein
VHRIANHELRARLRQEFIDLAVPRSLELAELLELAFHRGPQLENQRSKLFVCHAFVRNGLFVPHHGG